MQESIQSLTEILQIDLDAFDFYIQSPDGQYDTYVCEILQSHMAKYINILRSKLYDLIVAENSHFTLTYEYQEAFILIQKCSVAIAEKL